MAIKIYSPKLLFGDFAVDTDTFFVDVSTDRVGIGTASPSGELHVKSASANANLYIQRSIYDPWRLSAGSTYLAFMQDASEKMRIDSSGNVGIGTNSPSSKLAVQSGISTSSATVISLLQTTNGAAKEAAAFGISIQNGGESTNAADLWFKTASGGSTSEKMRITSSGNVGIKTSSPSTDLEIGDSSGNAAITINKSTSGTGTLYFDNANANKVYLQADSGEHLRIATNNTERIRVTDGGNVLIGTTTDSGQKLQVSGNAKVTGVFYTDYVQTLSGTSIDFRHQDASTIMRVDTANARVGIGTTSPAYTLDVNGSLHSTNINIADGIYHEGDTNTYMQFHANDQWRVVTGGAERLEVNSSSTTVQNVLIANDFVGIGTSSPNHKLDIYSNENVPLRIHRPSNANLDSSGAWGIGFSTRGDAITSTTDTRAGIFSYYNGNLFIATSTSDVVSDPDASARLTVTSAGNVLIGTTTDAGYKLDVAGEAIISGANKLYLRDSFTYIWESNGLTLDSGHSTRPIKALIGGSEKFRVHTDGNVGIGTTSPAKKLDVNGDAYIRASGTGQTLLIGRASSQPTIKADSTNGGYLILDSLNNFLSLNHYVSQNVVANNGGGNFLIGTTTDGGYKLNVNGTAFAQTAYVDDYIYHAGDTNTAVGFLDDAIEFYAGGVKMIKLTEGSADIVTVNPDSADVNFQVNGDTVANLLFVDAGTSKVGIGTSSPAYRLDIKGTSNNAGDGNQIFSVGNTAGGTQLAIGSSEDSYTWIRSYESGVGGRDLALVTNGEAARIKSNGNILIGTTTDSGYYKVDIDGPTRITGDTSTNGTVRFSSDKGTYNSHIHYGTDGDWYIRSATASGKVVIQDVGAVVGIGTSSPSSSYKLDVNGDTNVAGDYYANGSQGWSGTININANPPVSITVEGGIITNVT